MIIISIAAKKMEKCYRHKKYKTFKINNNKRKNLISYTSSHRQIRKPIYKDTIDRQLPYRNLLYKYGKKYDWFK